MTVATLAGTVGVRECPKLRKHRFDDPLPRRIIDVEHRGVDALLDAIDLIGYRTGELVPAGESLVSQRQTGDLSCDQLGSGESFGAQCRQPVEDGRHLVAGGVLAVREDRDDASTWSNHTRRLGERGDRVGHELQHPHEECSVDRVVRDRQLVDVGHSHALAHTANSCPHHLDAEIDADDIEAVATKSMGDDAGADTKLDDPTSDDPWSEVVGETVASSLAATGCVVDVGDAIERGSGHARNGTAFRLTLGSSRQVAFGAMTTTDAGVPGSTTPRFESVQSVRDALRDVNYLADEGIAGVAYLADRLQKPILVEGPAGTGKTQLAKSIAEITDARLIRLQCYEGLDESKALYEWNYKKQLLRIQTERGDNSEDWTEIKDDIFSDEFLLTRPLLEAITATDPVVLLIDEVDRVEVETEALLLEILSDYQVSIPELGTLTATQIPLVFLTSNNTRELSEALKRRCLYLHVDYPQLEREKAIVLAKVPDITEHLADQVARVVRSIRQLDLKKAPSVSETLDWARTLMLLNIDNIDEQTAKDTLNVLLKYQTDIAKAAKELSVDE